MKWWMINHYFCSFVILKAYFLCFLVAEKKKTQKNNGFNEEFDYNGGI